MTSSLGNMSSLADTLKASGGTESAGFLNDIVSHLWPNINVAGCNMVKEIVEPLLQSTTGFSSLHFIKLDLGPVPISFSNVDVIKTEKDGIKLDMNLDWDGKCDISLDGSGAIPEVGIKSVQLHGRVSVLLCPITNVIPLIGALQIAFINPPTLSLDYTGAISFLEFDKIENAIRDVILGVIGGMAVLPNRFLVNMAADNDYFKTYVPHVGMIRITVEGANNITGPKKSGVKKLLDKLARDVPDCYCKVAVGAEKPWSTSVIENKHSPKWNESHDFLVMDHDQCIMVEVNDKDVDEDDHIGVTLTTVKELLLNGGSQELELKLKNQPTGATVKLSAKFYNLAPESEDFLAQAQDEGAGLYCGVANVLIDRAGGLSGKKEDLNPSVKVTWGKATEEPLQTAAVTYAPGTDIFSPSFNTPFRIPITRSMVSQAESFSIILMNKKEEIGKVDVPFQDVVSAPQMTLEREFDVGSGMTVRASFSFRCTKLAQ
ncbi:hypothetical protein F5Y18DRAFT_382691 [Xylariaceae sp. FL1019]|nr:hypothetical protein F5Y18DRAFT_382691 [Xylariaceae sp. FL1019]